ncbi:OmpA family protein [Neolewinella aurantiaca]|uniref:OmpA family protein n=1 Tax=Neolewinella aurantiaca TaxID=2602767 RepID=A0A5C7FCH3_9BACT|nr:OmpA family protein [Neolewinella aurantiaca]TXF85037.1 OmpA family protein [Neolewinella aurantiaca]
MSNLLKFFLMALAWALLWAVSYYGCIKPEYCPDDQAAVTAPVTPAPAAVTNDYEIVSKTGSAEVLTGTLWDGELNGLLAKFKADPTQQLEVYGHYYEGEVPAPGDRALGQSRADAIKAILVKAGIPAASITATPRAISSAVPAEGKLWDAGAFAWVQAAEEGQKDKVTEISSDQIKINFPYNESTTRLSNNTENYLKTLAQRMTETNETVAIVGHTDVRGRDDYNMTLGQKRADFVKKRLVSYGVQANRISTSSMGETRPEIPNATTDAQHYENRRAILTLNRVQ